MPAYAVIGGQWGDEGKGKVVDFLSQKADMVARFNGGNNAGHTVITDQGEFKFHIIPVGILRPEVTCIIGQGVVVSPDALLHELAQLQSRSVDTRGLHISDRTHVIMPYHIELDRLEEAAKAEFGGAIGTTGMGVGPVYVDKASRTGIRMVDLLDEEALTERLRFVLDQKNAIITKLYGGDPLDFNTVYQKCVEWGNELRKFIKPVEPIIQEALAADKHVILEGAQGTMLDIDHGTYPYVTSSSPTVGGACTGLGISPRYVKEVVGVYKAYSTRVGSGPLITELDDELGDFIRTRAGEFGATTGRPRRCGWFDAVAGRYSVALNGVTSTILTRLDVLDGISPVKICVGYRYKDKVIDSFPSSDHVLQQCQPIYEEIPGWQHPTASARNVGDLSDEALHYVDRIGALINCQIDIISTGPGRNEVVTVRPVI